MKTIAGLTHKSACCCKELPGKWKFRLIRQVFTVKLKFLFPYPQGLQSISLVKNPAYPTIFHRQVKDRVSLSIKLKANQFGESFRLIHKVFSFSDTIKPKNPPTKPVCHRSKLEQSRYKSRGQIHPKRTGYVPDCTKRNG